MIEAGVNHCRIVRDSLCGEREVDEQSFASLTVLGERLERLKKSDEIFESVEFSPAAKELKKRRSAVAVS